jgi:ferredoxin
VAAPDIFSLEDFDVVAEVTNPEPGEEQRAQAEAAADACPTRAISIHH